MLALVQCRLGPPGAGGADPVHQGVEILRLGDGQGLNLGQAALGQSAQDTAGTGDDPGAGEGASAIAVGDLVGRIGVSEVRTPFAGQVIRWLAADGERVQEGQPLAWLRVPDSR